MMLSMMMPPAMKVLLEAGADPNAKDRVLDMRGMSVRV
jgi:hypothetical protein